MKKVYTSNEYTYSTPFFSPLFAAPRQTPFARPNFAFKAKWKDSLSDVLFYYAFYFSDCIYLAVNRKLLHALLGVFAVPNYYRCHYRPSGPPLSVGICLGPRFFRGSALPFIVKYISKSQYVTCNAHFSHYFEFISVVDVKVSKFRTRSLQIVTAATITGYLV